MYLVRPTFLMRKIYPSAIWRVPTKKKELFLTFDDGPIPEVTPWVLSQLKKYNAKATFFCIGENINKHPEIFQQLISEGHSIGNHTYNHLNGWRTKTKEYLENVNQCKIIPGNFHQPLSIIHYPFFRPPYGRMKQSQYSSLKSQYSVIMWDVLSGDFDQTISEEKCLKNVLSKTRAGSIIVFHDSLKAKKNLMYTLPKFLEHFSEKGFEFEGLTALQEI